MKNLYRLFVLSCLLLSACGFTPVHGGRGPDGTPVASALNNVAIASIPDREGQILRNRLIDRMYGHGRPKEPSARLEVFLKFVETDLGIQKDATATRLQLRLIADYVLTDMNDKLLVRGTAQSMVSTSKLAAQYATLAAEQNARERALLEVAEQIVNRLSAYYAEAPHAP